MDAAVNQLRADGFDVHDEDVARLSPFVRHHINMLGRYSFQLPDLPGGLRPLQLPEPRVFDSLGHAPTRGPKGLCVGEHDGDNGLYGAWGRTPIGTGPKLYPFQ